MTKPDKAHTVKKKNCGARFVYVFAFLHLARWISARNNSEIRGLATAFDLAAFRLSMIAPVKESVNHSRTVASMRETDWDQQQHQEVRLRSDSRVWSEFAFGPVTMTPGWPCNKPDLTMKETILYSAAMTPGKHGPHKYPWSFARLQ